MKPRLRYSRLHGLWYIAWRPRTSLHTWGEARKLAAFVCQLNSINQRNLSMNRSDLIVRITTAERQLASLREELEKWNDSRYYLEEKRRYDGKLRAVVIRDRHTLYSSTRPVATVDRVGSLTEEEVLESANRLLAMYRGSEK